MNVNLNWKCFNNGSKTIKRSKQSNVNINYKDCAKISRSKIGIGKCWLCTKKDILKFFKTVQFYLPFLHHISKIWRHILRFWFILIFDNSELLVKSATLIQYKNNSFIPIEVSVPYLYNSISLLYNSSDSIFLQVVI